MRLETEFHLHPKLTEDALFVADLALSRLLLMDCAEFPWFILVPRRAAATEWFDLEDDDLARLTQEIKFIGATAKSLYRADKINIAALGNLVPQLHVHIVARFHDDMAWPSPIWGKVRTTPYVADQAEREIAQMRRQLGLRDGA